MFAYLSFLPHLVSFQEGNTNPPHMEWNPTTQEYVHLGPPQENTEVDADDLSDSLSSMMKADEKEIAQMFDETADDEPVRGAAGCAPRRGRRRRRCCRCDAFRAKSPTTLQEPREEEEAEP